MTALSGELRHRLGNSLRAIRHERGLSQEGLGELLERHRTYVGGLERGERNPSLRVVEDLAARLGVEPCLLLCGLPGEPGDGPAAGSAWVTIP